MFISNIYITLFTITRVQEANNSYLGTFGHLNVSNIIDLNENLEYNVFAI